VAETADELAAWLADPAGPTEIWLRARRYQGDFKIARRLAKPAEPAPVATETAADVFKNRCTPCHGVHGVGDGPAAAALNPKPRNYIDPAWQKSVTDDQLKKTTLYGGAAVGKSAIMRSQPDLESRPRRARWPDQDHPRFCRAKTTR
jgi:mono/diheme cytochrome c family protein